jgi:hypothetical protein
MQPDGWLSNGSRSGKSYEDAAARGNSLTVFPVCGCIANRCKKIEGREGAINAGR